MRKKMSMMIRLLILLLVVSVRQPVYAETCKYSPQAWSFSSSALSESICFTNSNFETLCNGARTTTCDKYTLEVTYKNGMPVFGKIKGLYLGTNLDSNFSVNQKYEITVSSGVTYYHYQESWIDNITKKKVGGFGGSKVAVNDQVVALKLNYYYFDKSGKKTLANGWNKEPINKEGYAPVTAHKCEKAYYRNGKLKYHLCDDKVYVSTSYFGSGSVKEENLATAWINNVRYTKGVKTLYKDKNGVVKKIVNGKETNTTMTMWVGLNFYKHGILHAVLYDTTTKKIVSTGKLYLVDSKGNVTDKLGNGWFNKKYFKNGVFVAQMNSDYRIYTVVNNKVTTKLYNYNGKIGNRTYRNGVPQ